MKKESVLFKRVDKPSDRKLKYEGFCPKCNKTRDFRFDGGSINESRYRCITCGNIVSEPDVYISREEYDRLYNSDTKAI